MILEDGFAYCSFAPSHGSTVAKLNTLHMRQMAYTLQNMTFVML
jgi:hypothetical protein